MKRFSIMMLLLVSLLTLSAQQPFTYQHHNSRMQDGSVMIGFQPMTGGTVSGGTSGYMPAVVMPSMSMSGSKYSSNVSAVGAQMPQAELSAAPPAMRRGFDPDPFDPMPQPVGEVPFVLMALLAGGYAAGRRKK